MNRSAGHVFRQLITSAPRQKPTQLLGVVNAYSALLAQRSGAQALYLSGSGVATASYGLPDLGITSLDNVLEDVRRITGVTKLPLLVDADTGFGSAFNIARTVRELERSGAAALHIEDQATAKRCGHRPGKQIVPLEEMVDRIRTAVDARTDPQFVIMARTDALASEGIESAIARSKAYIAAGADMLFAEAVTQLDQYKRFAAELPNVPILANITEFGKTELFNVSQLGEAGVKLVLYPLSAHRAMAKAAETVFKSIIQNGDQKAVIPMMQTRDELYAAINYHDYEKKLDQLFEKKK